MKHIGLAITTLVLAGTLNAQSHPTFTIEIGADSHGNPQFTVTNLNSKTLGACVFRLGFSRPAGARGEMVWDSLLGESQWPNGEPHLPIRPNESETLNLSHVNGLPLPDKIDVLAGIWSDGETFGDKTVLNEIYGSRDSELAAYELGISVLREALDKDWTADQLLAALNDKPSNFVVSAIRAAFGSAIAPKESPGSVKLKMHLFIADFTQKADLLRSAKRSYGIRQVLFSPPVNDCRCAAIASTGRGI
jgi:hypothetical protein